MTTFALIWRIAIVIFFVEAAIILTFWTTATNVPTLLLQYPLFIVFLDVITLTFISSPIIYFWAIRPIALAQVKADLLLSLKDRAQHHTSLFAHLPLGVVIEDFSAVKKIVDQLSSEGIDDLKTYLRNNPELLRELVTKIRFVEANNAFFALYGCGSVQEITEVSRWWNDDWLNYYASEIAAFTSPKKEYTTEILDSRVDGSAFETRTISAVAKGDQESWKRVLTIYEDITLRHQMEENSLVNQNLLERLVQERTDKLIASEEYYRTLVDTANAPIFGIDAQGKINEWNQQAEQITGYTKQEVMDKDLVENFITAKYKASVGDVLANALKGEETANYEFPLFTKSGHRVDILLNSTTLRDATGQIVGVVGVGKDVTELNKIKDEQEQVRQETDKTKSQFISTVSHELRTPLTSIKGALGLIQAGVFDHAPEKLQSTIQVAYKNTERLHKLIDNILNLEQLEIGAKHFDMHSMDLSALLQDSVVANAGYGSEYGVSVFCSGIEEPLLVNGDYDGLMQVLGNLLSNAVKFSPRGGQVEACVARHEGRVRIAVKDNGCGIPAEARCTIFDKFTQVDASDQHQKGGSGLGLNITKMIVEEHLGNIDFTSEVDKGTTFYVDLPELAVEVGVQPVLRVLLVDDQALVVEALSTLITSEGTALGVQVVATVSNAKEALIQVQNLRPDLVLMDMHMPDINGNEAVESIKRNQPNTKTLMLSGSDCLNDVRAAKAAGADGYAYKSDSPKSLITDISKVMSVVPVFVSKYDDTLLS
ncbi:MAG: PAS domain S-box-containing protein [Porticoccaceae bacterium]|jgi:PAS domain S-box-containing protein